MSKEEKFIGSRKIRMVLNDPDDGKSVKITFKDNTEVKITRKLFDVIVKPKKGNGETIEEVANAYVASKFLKELADYGYERYQMEGLASALGNIIHNLCEEAIGKKFGVAGSLNIKLSDII